jgi:hypothetical protein
MFLFSINGMPFSGEFGKLRKATNNFIVFVFPAVCSSVRIKQLGSITTDFDEI